VDRSISRGRPVHKASQIRPIAENVSAVYLG
jgi:hypothetical protein